MLYVNQIYPFSLENCALAGDSKRETAAGVGRRYGQLVRMVPVPPYHVAHPGNDPSAIRLIAVRKVDGEGCHPIVGINIRAVLR